jgi:calmodulin
MAISFTETDIEEFRDCFSLYAREKYISSPDQLTIIMRSLAFSPTTSEVQKYFSQYQKDGRIDFATFVGILDKHSKMEKCQNDIVNAFKSHDRTGQGVVPASELRFILTSFGDKMSSAEVDKLFRDANVQSNGQVRYDDIIKVLLTPIQDY